MCEQMMFHKTWEEFEDFYGFKDHREIYTNGSRLIASFRVKQWLDNLEKHGHWIQDRLCSTSGSTYGVRRCSVCEDYYQDIGYGWNYCPNCGAKMDESEEEDEQIH